MRKEGVYQLVIQIPKGRVTTYLALAKASGNPRAARAVGMVLKNNPMPIKVPCHRVICSDGRLGGYGGNSPAGIRKKVRLLSAEGVEIISGKSPRVRFPEKFLFTEFS